MNTQVGEDLDLVMVDWSTTSYIYSRVKTQAPFDSATRLEAQDPQGKYFISITGKQLTLTADKSWKFEMQEDTSQYIQGTSEQGFIVLAKTAAVVNPVLIGSLKGVFANSCNTQNATFQSGAAGSIWVASGSVDSVGAVPLIVGKVTGGMTRARMFANGQEYELRAVIRDSQVSGQWIGALSSGSFALQSNTSFDKLDFVIESSECTPPLKWEGRFTSLGSTYTFSLSDVKMTKGWFTANGLEQGRAFTLTGPVVGTRARLIKQYKGSPEQITMHMRVGKGFMQGVWVLQRNTGDVSFGTV